MAKPKGITGKTNRKWSTDEKLKIVKLHLEEHWSYGDIAKEYKLSKGLVHAWVARYLEADEEGFKPKPNNRNTMVSLYRKKSLSENEVLQLENFQLKVENARLKKGYQVKGVGSKKEYIPTSKMNTK